MAPKSSSSKRGGKTPSTGKHVPDIDPNSSFTAESFERELQSLAAKAKNETWGKWAAEQGSAYLKSAVLLALMGVYSNVSQMALSPVYGSIPASTQHARVMMAACFVGWSSNLLLNRILPVKPRLLLPIIALYIPVAQLFLSKLSGLLTARWGPLVTEVLTLLPLASLSAACVATYLEDADFSGLPKWLGEAAPGLGSYGFYKGIEALSAQLLPRYMGASVANTRLGLQVVLGASYALFAPSRLLLLLAVPALLHTALLDPRAPTPYALARLNATLGAEGWMVLDRRESLTGYLSVLENTVAGFRVMRCDHSLLGGEWVRFKGSAELQGNRVAEPIYGVFAMLEAVRLVERPVPVPDSEASALVIGLGIGTTPAALVAHAIDTTVVEIDPVVHEFASRYFHLPRNHTPVIEDAVIYAARLAGDPSAERFDYIVHDVFTGGAEPAELFTLEFLQDLEALLKPDGVIAINYAGDLALPGPLVAVQTIRAVFPACRVFREHPRNEAEFAETGRDFVNMVVFCTKKTPATTGDGPVVDIQFRRPTPADLLNSPSRRQFLPPRHEVADAEFLVRDGDKEGAAVLRRNETQKVAKWHETSALGHWAVMRTVLPPVVWENW